MLRFYLHIDVFFTIELVPLLLFSVEWELNFRAEFQCDLSEKCAINSRQIDFLETCHNEIAQDTGQASGFFIDPWLKAGVLLTIISTSHLFPYENLLRKHGPQMMISDSGKIFMEMVYTLTHTVCYMSLYLKIQLKTY